MNHAAGFFEYESRTLTDKLRPPEQEFFWRRSIANHNAEEGTGDPPRLGLSVGQYGQLHWQRNAVDYNRLSNW
jgi:hypothetical protein